MNFTRRHFLTTSAAVGLGVAAGPAWNRSGSSQLQAAPAAITDPQAGWIDAHVHVWTPDLARYPISADFKVQDMVPPSFTPEELFAHTQGAGVSRIVLIQMSFYKFDNSYMLDVMKQYPGVFGGVAIIDHERADAPEHMKKLGQAGVRGFRLYTDKAKAESWSGSRAMQTMWATGAETGQAMCLLANPDALPAVDGLCARFPKTPVVIDHFARIGMTGKVEPNDLDNLCRLARYPNVYVKTSAFYALGAKSAPYTDLVSMIMRLVKEYGAERLMWASDCPYQVQGAHSYAASIDLIKQLSDLTQSQREAILKGTAQKVFFS